MVLPSDVHGISTTLFPLGYYGACGKDKPECAVRRQKFAAYQGGLLYDSTAPEDLCMPRIMNTESDAVFRGRPLPTLYTYE